MVLKRGTESMGQVVPMDRDSGANQVLI